MMKITIQVFIKLFNSEEKVQPFWLGGKTFSIDNPQLDNRWNFEYENLDKDGFFIQKI